MLTSLVSAPASAEPPPGSARPAVSSPDSCDRFIRMHPGLLRACVTAREGAGATRGLGWTEGRGGEGALV